MSAEKSLDADAFMRKYLKQPSDATARLVFADWLEETGEEHNAAWAHFIRLKIEAARYPLGSPIRHEIERHAGQYALQIRAQLAIPAKLFVGYPKSFLQLLPEQNITVRLAEFEVPRAVLELVPELVARENLVIPLDAQERALLVAAANPCDYDTVQKLQFILNRDIVTVGGEREDVQEALDRNYGQTEVETVDEMLVAFEDTAGPFARMPSPIELLDEDDDSPVVRLLNLILSEAVNLRADGVHFSPDPNGIILRYQIDGAWTDHQDRIPLRLLRRIAARFAISAGILLEWVSANPPSLTPVTGSFSTHVHGIRFHIEVTITPSPDGPTTHLTLCRVPVGVEDP